MLFRRLHGLQTPCKQLAFWGMERVDPPPAAGRFGAGGCAGKK